MPKMVKIDVSPYVAKLLTIEASYNEISWIELANKIILDAISQKTKDYVGPEGNEE
jgi:aminoglycoside N3'-acetyltransferase